MLLRFPNKTIRAATIADYVQKAEYRGCVCFSCGNASAALKEAGLYVVDVSPNGALMANRWWTPEQIRKTWPDLFDATSGHLPAFLMIRIAKEFRKHLGDLKGSHKVPTGSGETIMCLHWAYPGVSFAPVFDCGPGTERNAQSPLLEIVDSHLSVNFER